jgi:glycosyltransferase involved in cell wall biosynthesis/SAM-dependent methyltransferase
MDVVADAYFGTVGSQQLIQDTRERIDWFLHQIGPGAVLDIGCSQGILAILLARRGGADVTGVDILDAAVVDAKRRLGEEPETVQQAVRFAQIDFLTADISAFKGRFDTVVIGQVLEHLGDPAAFVARAVSCLAPAGRILVTVPYGVRDPDEHEETYFVHTLFGIMSPLVTVTQIDLVGGRLAMAGTLKSDGAQAIPQSALQELEERFSIQKERQHLDHIGHRIERDVRLMDQDAVPREQNAQLDQRSRPAPHRTFLEAIAVATIAVSKDRFELEMARARATPVRRLLKPLHWLRLQFGLRLARGYNRAARGNPEARTVIGHYLLGPQRGRFHNRDVGPYLSKTIPLLEAFLNEVLSKKTGGELKDVASIILDHVPEPRASLILFHLHQARGEFDHALVLCRNLLDGKCGELKSGERRKLHREPVARLLAGDLLPERKVEPVFKRGGRIGYVAHNSLPYVTVGYTTRTQGFADGMLRSGQDLVVITRPGFPLNVVRGLNASNVPLAEVIEGVPYRRILEPVDRRELPFDYVRLAADGLEKTFVAEGVQTVIAASNYVCALPAIIAARRLGLPSVYEVRGFWEISGKSRDPAFGDTADFKSRVAMETMAACAADRVLTLTAGMRNELIRRGVGPERIFLAPNGFRPTMLEKQTDPQAVRARLNIPENCPVIGYIGSITPYEGLEDLTTACVGLYGRGIDFRLLIVGSEKALNNAPAAITQHITRAFSAAGISDKLIMTGRVPFEEVPSYYSIVDIAPIPRKPFEVSELVSPIKPLEAMAFGTALVVSSVAALTEIVTDGVTGYVFEKGNLAALEDTLHRAINDPNTRRRIAAEGKRFALEERGWEKIAEKAAGFLFRTDLD